MKICVCNICRKPLTNKNTNSLGIIAGEKLITKHVVPDVELCDECQLIIRDDFDQMIQSFVARRSVLYGKGSTVVQNTSAQVGNGAKEEPKKRGRKPKPKEETEIITVPKKRGRKPKPKEDVVEESENTAIAQSNVEIKIDSADIEDTGKEPVAIEEKNSNKEQDSAETSTKQDNRLQKGKKQFVENDDFYKIKEMHANGDDEKYISNMLRISTAKVRECFDFDTFEQYEESHGKHSFDVGKCKALLKAKWTVEQVANECKVSQSQVLEVLNSMQQK